MKTIEFPKEIERKKNLLDSLVFSSRIRIARNIEGLKFPLMLSDQDKNEIDSQIGQILKELPLEVQLEKIDQFDQETLMTYLANRVITHEFLKNGRVLAFEASGEWAALINEDDHLRIFSIETGYNLKNMYNRISSVAAQVEQSVDFSYDETHGYLTSSILNIGTGLRASCLVNLYGLTATKKIENFIETAGKIGFAVINIAGAPDCGLFMIYNIFSLGISEEEIIAEMENFLTRTWALESQARTDFFSRRDDLELAFEEIFELSIMERLDWSNLLYYLSLLDALHKQKIQLRDQSALRKLFFLGNDDYLQYRKHVDPDFINSVRLNLLKKESSSIRYKNRKKTD